MKFKRIFKCCDKPRYFWIFGMTSKIARGWHVLSSYEGEAVYIENSKTGQWYTVYRIMSCE